LLANDEHTRPSDHPKLRIAKARDSDDLNLVDLLRWLGQSRPLSDDEVRIGLKRWVSEYTVSQRPQLRAVSATDMRQTGG
jgi:hypothetical protein